MVVAFYKKESKNFELSARLAAQVTSVQMNRTLPGWSLVRQQLCRCSQTGVGSRASRALKKWQRL
jgi:hypothetical protein